MGARKPRGTRSFVAMFATLAVVSVVLVKTTGIAAALPLCAGAPDSLEAFDDPNTDALHPDGLYHVTFGAKLTISIPQLLANDCGPAGTKVASPDDFLTDTTSWYGVATITRNATTNSFVYTPDPTNPFSGPDTFQYSIYTGLTQDDPTDSASAFVNIQVDPIVKDDFYSTPKNTKLVVSAANGIFKNDLGADPTSLTADPFSSQGVEINVNDDGSFQYTPPTNFTGVDTFQYTVTDLSFDTEYTATVHISVAAPPPPPPPKPKGYWMVGATGTVYPFGQVKNYGNVSTFPVTHIEPTPSKLGYWIVNGAGRVFAKGNAKSFGNFGTLRRGELVSSLSTTPTGKGYWLFSNRGKVVARGDAKFFGDVRNLALSGPVVGSISTPTGKGYYMVASDGGIFAFGDARFFGSMGGKHLNKPVNGLVPTAANTGYWLVASDGGIFAFNAPFRGSMGAVALNKPVIGMVRYGNGYLMVGSDGGIFNFSNLPFFGSLGANPPAIPIVGVAAGG